MVNFDVQQRRQVALVGICNQLAADFLQVTEPNGPMDCNVDGVLIRQHIHIYGWLKTI